MGKQKFFQYNKVESSIFIRKLYKVYKLTDDMLYHFFKSLKLNYNLQVSKF